MYSTYCVGSDIEMNRMFDQYLFKGTESFDLSLSIPDPTQENANAYMTSDQTFHTPSFGDEEFEIPPISLPPPPSSMASSEGNNGNMGSTQGYNPPVMTHAGMGEPVSVMSLGGTHMSSQTMNQPMMSTNAMVASQGGQLIGQQPHYTHGLYLQSMGEGGTILTSQADGRSQSFETQPTYTLSSPQQQAQQQGRLLIQQQQTQAMMGATLLTTLSPPQLGLQFVPPRAPSVSGSPPGSNQTSPSLHETSEDSDDSAHVGGSTPLLQLMSGMKRPSPEPADIKVAAVKKAKVPKKKKKRDPNEPQKPVSAYALFFRDTQAAIKGQNPNASFGEVSKIVASMWDSLDAEHKNVYKKKTEAAKKDYLKALAAYRASLVSKQTSSDQMDSLYHGSGHSPYSSSGSFPQTTAISSSTVMMATTLSPSMSQLQQHPSMAVQHQGMQQQQQHPSRPASSGYHPSPASYQQQTNLPPGGGGQQPMASPQGVASNQPLTSRSTNCLRNGCPNPAVESPDWDSEYCRTYLLPGWLPARLPILLPQ